MAKQNPPADLLERFLPQERPAFRLLRRVGPCCLWRSQTVEHESHGCTRHSRVHYHVTTGEEAGYVLMPVFGTAMLSLVLSAAEASSS